MTSNNKTVSRETKINCFPRDQSLSVYYLLCVHFQQFFKLQKPIYNARKHGGYLLQVVCVCVCACVCVCYFFA